MLTGEGIKKAVDAGKIEITYTCFPDSNKNFLYFPKEVSPSYSDESKDFFRNSVGENRIKLTVGPLLKSIHKSHSTHSSHFESFNVHDLRKSAYTIDPLETVIVYTNEWIKLNNGYSGIIIQRVAHYFKGLSIAPSYVASGWEGILLAQITNNSVTPQKISIGSDIARLFIFETVGENETLLPNTSVHFGKKWSQYLVGGEKRNPFEEFSKDDVTREGNDALSLLMMATISNSKDLQNKITELISTEQKNEVINLLKNDKGLQDEVLKIYSNSSVKKHFFSFVKNQKIMSFIGLLLFIYMMATASAFYYNIYKSPKLAFNSLIDFSGFSAKMDEVDKNIKAINSSMPLYGNYSISIDKAGLGKAITPVIVVKKGKRTKIVIVSKNKHCGEIVNDSFNKGEEEYSIQFSSKYNKSINVKCDLTWAYIAEK